MKLHELNRIKARTRKRVGRGIGSGRGKTAGRGSKGQKARGKIPATFTGTPALYKKLPLRKGLGNPKLSLKPVIISLSSLDAFKIGESVDIQSLIEKGIITQKNALRGVKILGGGDVKKKLHVKIPVSNSVQKLIEKAKGTVAWKK